MKELGLWTRDLKKTRRVQLKTRKKISKISSQGEFLLSRKERSSRSGESAAVRLTHMSLFSFSDDAGKGDDDPAVARTVETLSVAGSDDSVTRQEKEARSVGGIPSR